jgi:glycosyltransferase involved in cell wall biosynthesis
MWGPCVHLQPGQPTPYAPELVSEPVPKFSVLIPSYNRPEYLPLAVASVLVDASRDFELIVSDNCSPRQAEIVSGLSPFRGDGRLRFFAQPENLGEARNRHFLMQQARGSHRIIFGDDDMLLPGALSVLRDTLARNPGFDIYFLGYSVIDEQGTVVETRRALAPLVVDMEHFAVVRDIFCSDLFPYWFYHPATFLFPASLHRDIVPNHNVGIGDDLIFVFDAIAAGKRALILPEVLFSYRRFTAGAYAQTNLSKSFLGNVITRRHILYDLLARGNLPVELRALVNSREFRCRFLYDSIVIDPDATLQAIEQLDLRPEHLAEARAYWRKRRTRWYPQWLQLHRVARFTGYFGLAGLLDSFRVFRQRRVYVRRQSRPPLPVG